MIEIPSLRPETRYGIPPADHMLFNREYIVGYSYLFRQARWAMEVIDPENKAVNVERKDPFRADLRIPEQFRATLEDFSGSGYDRGHLVPSADRRATRLQNSETFLLTNMSPQLPEFNRKIWRVLEEAVRNLAALYLEVYVVCGPVFAIKKPIEVVGDDPSTDDDVYIPIPHAYFKSILAEDGKNNFKMWSFILPHQEIAIPKKATPAQLGKLFGKHLVPTSQLEMKVGFPLWDRLRGEKADKLRKRSNKIWSFAKAEAAMKKLGE